MTADAPQKKERYSLLLVDDDPEILTLLKAKFKDEPFDVFTAAEGASALSQIRAHKPDLIVLDIMMPGTPVKDVIKSISGINILFLSVVRTSEEEKKELLTYAGVVDYLQKPFEIQKLLMMVERTIGS